MLSLILKLRVIFKRGIISEQNDTKQCYFKASIWLWQLFMQAYPKCAFTLSLNNVDVRCGHGRQRCRTALHGILRWLFIVERMGMFVGVAGNQEGQRGWKRVGEAW